MPTVEREVYVPGTPPMVGQAMPRGHVILAVTMHRDGMATVICLLGPSHTKYVEGDHFVVWLLSCVDGECFHGTYTHGLSEALGAYRKRGGKP